MLQPVGFFVVLLMMLVTFLDAYPDRIPVTEHPEICESMEPTHNITALTSECPYKIIFNTNNCYTDNQKISVTVYHEMERGFFEGLFLQARKTDGSKESIGTFDSDGDDMFQAYSCGRSVNNTFGHRGHDHFEKTVLTWTPPPGFDNEVEFVATVVRSTYRYWMNVKSPALRWEASCNQFPVTDPPLKPTLTTSEAPMLSFCYFHTSLFAAGLSLFLIH